MNIDSIFLEQAGKIDKVFYNHDNLHELRSCAKLLVAMAIGIAIDKGLSIANEPLTLNTKIFPIIKDIANITNKSNIDNYILNNTVEGYYTLIAINQIIKKKEISLPLVELLYKILFDGLDKKEIFNLLIKN